MNWREWTYTKLTTSGPITALIPTPRILSSGAVKGRPSKAIIVIRLLNLTPVFTDAAHRQPVEIWVHDQPGSYELIDSVLGLVRATLVGPVPLPGATACEWLGDSQEFADEGMGTITRFGSFQMVGSGN